MLQRVPGAMLFLGAAAGPPGQPAGTDDDWAQAPDNHSPYVTFDDSVLPDGATLLAALAERSLRG